ncbi:TIGR02285 family protein [Pseudomonas mosselii]|uniref:TIGR02285 family protein n=1 Tax=Pseudomonas mosselii TaxID=78327 RepID=UPI0007702F2E|nr:TIGR02285 family protein [Pseudomonas mosselii]AMK32572.1 NAD(FAD)-utilizing enzyme [Pseudomonas putida]MBC3450221.1 TIGR02285 family protein [Pseudomonas mosselii]MDH1659035.1 TIGR02285 family protein [Pseudomonas mosselii]MDH1718607.1 TIGR02285 family protein [Pseudomonas mosselii]MDH1721951.1 TIGR02285 family protein [Pseudomonas mosselii]
MGIRHLPIVLCLLLTALAGQMAEARERLLWLVRDLPPFTIFEGPAKGQGVIDQLLPMLIARMPEYDHRIVRVNRARGLQMLQEPSFTCDPTLLWTPERARYVHFSQPSLGVLSSGLIVRKQDQALLAPYLEGQQVDLQRLLAETHLKLGIVAERSYSAQVDEVLRNLPDAAFSRHYGNDATASLLQMQQLGRLQLVLGYWPEMRYLIQQQNGSLDDYSFHPILAVNRYQFLHVGCSDTPLGREAIAHIDQLLPTLRRGTLPELYAHWLDPGLQEDYLEQARHFFEQGEPSAR